MVSSAECFMVVMEVVVVVRRMVMMVMVVKVRCDSDKSCLS